MGQAAEPKNELTCNEREALGLLIDDWSHRTFFAGPGLDEDGLREGICRLYELSRVTPPEIHIMDSPLHCQLQLQSMAKEGADMGRVEPVVWPSIDFRMWSGLWWQVMGEFLRQKQADALSNVEENIITMTRQKAVAGGENYFEFSEDNLLRRYRRVAYYDFLVGSGRVSNNQIGTYSRFLRTGCFLTVFIRGHALACRRPVAVRYNARGQFHCTDAPALEWRSGEKEYFLNGVRVPEGVVLCPPEQVDATIFLMERNLEVRREIIRRVGIEILISRLGGRVLDRWNGYELIQLNVPDMRIKPTYLKMRNPSIGTFHVEGVPPNIRTCREALSWRVGGLNWNPEQLT